MEPSDQRYRLRSSDSPTAAPTATARRNALRLPAVIALAYLNRRMLMSSVQHPERSTLAGPSRIAASDNRHQRCRGFACGAVDVRTSHSPVPSRDASVAGPTRTLVVRCAGLETAKLGSVHC